MKTKLKLFGFTAILFVCIYLQHRSKSFQSDLLMINVEALANMEGNSDVDCIYIGSTICPITGVKVYIVR